LSKEREREREIERERESEGERKKAPQMTITWGQYFIEMKCCGTVYSGQGEKKRGRNKRMDAKLLSHRVFLLSAVAEKETGSGDWLVPRGLCQFRTEEYLGRGKEVKETVFFFLIIF
jgi:hypothetical protein